MSKYQIEDPEPLDGPGPWIQAAFDGECTRDGVIFPEGTTIRADGSGGWECQNCVREDETDSYIDAEIEAVTARQTPDNPWGIESYEPDTNGPNWGIR